jgi:hypothetical protein
MMLMLSAGCGDDDDDDNGGTTTDTTPTAFTFTNMTGVALNSIVTSAPITVSGINAPAPISVTGTGATYSIGDGAFTSAAGTVNNDQTVRVRHTSAAQPSTVTSSTLTIGGVSAPFISFTEAPAGADTTPVVPTFRNFSGAAQNTALTSDAVTVTGITAPVLITITGGTYSINGGAFTSNAGTVSNNQTVVLRQTSSGLVNTPTTTTVTIGGVSRSFTTTTQTVGGVDTTPNAITFTNLTSVALSTQVTSAPVTVTGITGSAPISISGGTYAIGGGAFTSAAGTVNNLQTVTVRHTSAATGNTVTRSTLNIGGITAPFTSTTESGVTDTTPAAFTFTNVTSVALSTVVTSTPITVTGINAPAPITVTGGTYSIEGGPFVSTAGTVANNQTVRVQHTSSASNSTVTATTLTIGGVPATFTSTTEGAGLNAFQLYQTKVVQGTTVACANCHSLGSLDPTSAAQPPLSLIPGPNLAGTTQMPLRFPNPGALPAHFDIMLTAEEIAALTALFASNP